LTFFQIYSISQEKNPNGSEGLKMVSKETIFNKQQKDKKAKLPDIR
jgi:hypothetical protein